MRYTAWITALAYGLTALVQLAGIAWVVDYAGEPDSYYNGGLTRWEHASRDNAAAWAVVAMTAASVIAVLFLARGITSRPKLGRFAFPLVAVYIVVLSAAWFALTVGH